MSKTFVFQGDPNSPAELMREEDRVWFEENPFRIIRMRYSTLADLIEAPNVMMLVFCPAVGVRFKFAARLCADMSQRIYDEANFTPQKDKAKAVDDVLVPLLKDAIDHCFGGRVAYFDGTTKNARPMKKWLLRLLKKAIRNGKPLQELPS